MKGSSTKRLFITLIITFVIFSAELIGGIISNSLALLSDAGHVFTDSFAIILSLIASIVVKKPSDRRATYGYQKIGILAAFINGISLIAIALLIIFEGYRRLIVPPEINSDLMLSVAFFGFLGNLLMALILGHKHEDLNIKSAWLHIIGDTISSAGVIFAGLVIKYTGWLLVDPLISLCVGCIIIYGGIRVLKESLFIFLDFAPKGFDVNEIASIITKIEGIRDVHDIHIWSIGYGIPAFSAHVVVEVKLLSEADKIRANIESELRKIGIKHSVIQIESYRCSKDSFYCDMQPPISHINQ